MKFGIITDPHLGPNSILNGTVRIWGEKAHENLNKAIRALDSHADLTFIAHLGDAIQESRTGETDPDRANFIEVAGIFKQSARPVHHLLGNHDPVNLPAEEVTKLLGMPAPFYSFDAGEYLGVVLFCPSINQRNPTLPKDQCEWLGDTLAGTEKEVLLFVHHSLAEHSLDDTFWFKGRPEKAFVHNRAEVLKILADSKKVRAGFNGHLHASNFTVAAGIPFFTFQSLSQAVEPGLEAAQAYAIVEIAQESVTVSILGNEPRMYSAKRNQ